MRVRALALLVAAALSAAVEGREICHHNSYTMSMRNNFCYRYVASSATYTQATERCERDQFGSSMLYITSAEEDMYIWTDMFFENGKAEFWLGLDDKINEGDFRWSFNNSRPGYKNFSSDIQDKNNDNSDCVKFTDTGWQVEDGFCENSFLPFVCKAPVCVSSDGRVCDVEPVQSESGGLSVGAIAAIAIVIIIVACVIVVLVALGLLWKFNNDFFHRYVCWCGGQGSKQAMMSLQQENQRLRQELNQLKMSSSSRFAAGHFGRESISGVPDGMGGMLPPIKQGGGFTSPDLFSPLSPTKPPPLSLQCGTSRVAPATTPSSGGPGVMTLSSGGPYFSSPPPTIFTAQSLRSPRQSSLGKPNSGGGVAVGGASLPTLKERENEEDISTASEDDTSPTDKADEGLGSTEVKSQEHQDAVNESAELKLD